MRRGVVFVLGLCILAAGIWLIATEHTRNAVCNSPAGHLLSASNSCQEVAWAYFAGFVVAGIGIIVLLYTRLMRRHELRYRRVAEGPGEMALRADATSSLREHEDPPIQA